MSCNDTCQNHKVKKPKQGGRYEAGQKRCNSCNVFIEYDGLFCPCCNTRLRLSSRCAKLKEKFVKVSRIQYRND